MENGQLAASIETPDFPHAMTVSSTTDLARAACILSQAATTYASGTRSDRPDPDTVVAAMLAAERASKSDRKAVTLPELLGTWRLAFVTGTKKTRQRAGKAIGAGRYLPRLPAIHLAYEPESPDGASSDLPVGRAVNTVAFGPMALTVTGPIEAIAGKRILAFDFTRWSVALGSWMAYRGELGGGIDSEAGFSERPLKKRPFFNYFWVSETAIAARGKGGGLALWVRHAPEKSEETIR